VNFPARRLAAMAFLLARADVSGRSMLTDLETLARQFADALASARPSKRIHPAVKALDRWFEVKSVGTFWEGHYSFTAQPAPRPAALLGASTARSLAFNALLPALGLLARRRGDNDLAALVQRLYAIYPPLQPNHITEFMTRRLFGDDRANQSLINTERRRQALFQIFYSCCNGEERICDRCYYLGDG
jgi:hypothetical protein